MTANRPVETQVKERILKRHPLQCLDKILGMKEMRSFVERRLLSM